MVGTETRFDGVFTIDLVPSRDDRGETVKSYSEEKFLEMGFSVRWTQTLRVKNFHRGTLRGMHWQEEIHPETKLVSCLRGRVFDVLVDLRTGSPTFGDWHGFELSGDRHLAILIPPGVAHGYLTLEDECELLYQIAGEYRQEAQSVLHWNDPTVGIEWPFAPSCLSDRDADAPLWAEVVLKRLT